MTLRTRAVAEGQDTRVVLASVQRCIHDFEIVRVDPKIIDAVSRMQMAAIRSKTFDMSIERARAYFDSGLESYDNAYLLVEKRSGNVVGFALNLSRSKIWGSNQENGVNFSVAAIDPEFQGLGLYSEITRLRIFDAVQAGFSAIHITAGNPETKDKIRDTNRKQLRKLYDAGVISFFNTEIDDQKPARELKYNIRR